MDLICLGFLALPEFVFSYGLNVWEVLSYNFIEYFFLSWLSTLLDISCTSDILFFGAVIQFLECVCFVCFIQVLFNTSDGVFSKRLFLSSDFLSCTSFILLVMLPVTFLLCFIVFFVPSISILTCFIHCKFVVIFLKLLEFLFLFLTVSLEFYKFFIACLGYP